jgi:hypothetical protein
MNFNFQEINYNDLIAHGRRAILKFITAHRCKTCGMKDKHTEINTMFIRFLCPQDHQTIVEMQSLELVERDWKM